MINQTDERLLNGYLAGTLTDEEVRVLIDRKEINQDLKRKLMVADALDEPLNDWQSLQMRKKLAEIHYNETSSGMFWGIHHKWKHASIAAVFVMVIVGFSLVVLQYGESSSDLYCKFYQPAKPFLMQRSAGTSFSNDFTEAMQFYSKGDYSNAVRLLSSQPDNMAARFYLAVSMMEMKDYTRAIENLQVVSTDKTNLFNDQASWYLTLCYLKTGNKEAAKAELKNISASQSYFNDKATILLKEID